ncbi:hypothetical protein ACHAXS_004918 [Conticribra weissflogii]
MIKQIGDRRPSSSLTVPEFRIGELLIVDILARLPALAASGPKTATWTATPLIVTKLRGGKVVNSDIQLGIDCGERSLDGCQPECGSS